MTSLPSRNNLLYRIVTEIQPDVQPEGDADEDENTCSTCLDNKVSVKTPCNHSFCRPCLTLWLITSNSCPMCRTVLYDANTIPPRWPERYSEYDFNQLPAHSVDVGAVSTSIYIFNRMRSAGRLSSGGDAIRSFAVQEGIWVRIHHDILYHATLGAWIALLETTARPPWPELWEQYTDSLDLATGVVKGFLADGRGEVLTSSRLARTLHQAWNLEVQAQRQLPEQQQEEGEEYSFPFGDVNALRHDHVVVVHEEDEDVDDDDDDDDDDNITSYQEEEYESESPLFTAANAQQQNPNVPNYEAALSAYESILQQQTHHAQRQGTYPAADEIIQRDIEQRLKKAAEVLKTRAVQRYTHDILTMLDFVA